MVLVRSPRRGPGQHRPASPTRAAIASAAVEEKELVDATAKAQQTKSHPNDTEQEGNSPPAGAGTTGVAAIAAGGGRRSSVDRGASYASASFSPSLPEKRRSRPNSLPRRKSLSCGAGVIFSEAATQSSPTGFCRSRVVPRTAVSGQTHPAASVEVRDAQGVTDTRNAAATGAASNGAPAGSFTGPAGATREPTPRTAAVLPFSRSAARRLARMPANAATTATPVIADVATRAAAGGRQGSRVHSRSASRDVSESNSAVSLRLQPPHASAAVANTVSKRMRYGQQHSPPRTSTSIADRIPHGSRDSQHIIASFFPSSSSSSSSRKPPSSAPMAAPEYASPLRRKPSAVPAATQVVESTSSEDVSPKAVKSDGLVGSTCTAGGKSYSAATDVSAAVPDLPPESQPEVQQSSADAVNLLQQLPATRALHDYVLEATSSERLQRTSQVKKKEKSTSAHLSGSHISATASSFTGADPDVTKHIASGGGQLTLSQRAAPTLVAPTAAASGAATSSLGTEATASSLSISVSSCAPAGAKTISSNNAARSTMSAATASSTDNLSSAATRELVAAVGTAADGGSAGTLSSSRGTSGVSPAKRNTRSSSICAKQQQQLVLPKNAEELLREWSPTVDNLIQRLCDIREEEKQVTQYIILEGRSLRLLRHVSNALGLKRTEITAVHAKAAQQEAAQEEAHAESGKCFEVVHREAKDAAGGEVHLERRLKDTREKKERLQRLRRQVYEEMFGCALLREKKIEVAKQLENLKDSLAREEKRKNAIYQLLQRMTRFRLLHHVQGHYVLRAAVIPEGVTQHKQQRLEDEEEEEFSVSERSEDERKLLLQNQSSSREEDRLLFLLRHEQKEGATNKAGQPCGQSCAYTERQEERDHITRFKATNGRRFKKHMMPIGVNTGDSNNCDPALQYRREVYVEKNVGKAIHGFTKQSYPGQKANDRRKGSGSTTTDEETPGTGETESDVFSPCGESVTAEGENCRRMIAAKTAGEPAILTVDFRRRDGTGGVCRDVESLWKVIEDAIGLPPE